MALISRILFPVDFSDNCLGAARYVEAMAGRFQAGVLLLHVVGMGEHNLAEELLPQRQEQLNAFLADELKYFSVERLCLTGNDVAPLIAETARSWNADLVMMPTHGTGTFERLLLGSVTAEVLGSLVCPLWTSVHSDVIVPLEAIHCRRVLCALDLSDRSQSVLAWAASLAAEYQALLGIVHATAHMPAAVTSVSLEKELSRSVAEQSHLEIHNLQKAAGTQARVFIGSGDPAAVITDATKQFESDILVVGRGHSDDSYAIIRDSPCPVISI